ncbi:glycosyltransferase family 4 protein [Candidatus Woesearchaeota archaeon]|nr:glycosyltransferase family 4 protein [Candidatus Woesearchaeota archaeon]
MKKLLIATDTYLPRHDGVSSFLREVIPRLHKKFEITIVAPNFGNIEENFDISLIRFDTYKIQLGDQYPVRVNLSKLAKAIKHTDIVWVQAFGLIGIFSIMIAKRYGKPIIFYTHLIEWEVYPRGYGNAFLKTPIYIITKRLAKFFYNKCDLIMVSSEEILELLSWMHVAAKKRVIHLGVDSDKFMPAADIGKAKQRIGIEKNKFVIGYVGRLAYEKDLVTLYRAFIRLSKKLPEAVLLVVGAGRKDIKDMLSRNNNIILTGGKNNVVPYYQAMDLYVLPSLTETTSLTTLEAMSCGLAVITTQVGYISEYIKDKQNGMFFRKKDSYNLYTKLNFLSKNKDKLRILGKNARETILKKFSWKKTVKEIEEVLDKY